MKKHENDNRSRDDVELALIEAKIAETKSKIVEHYCVAASFVVGAIGAAIEIILSLIQYL